MSDENNNRFFAEEEYKPEDESFRDNKIYTYFGSKRGFSHRRHSRRKRRKRIMIAAVLLSIPLVLIAAVMILFFHYYNLMDIRSAEEMNVSYSDIEVTFTDAELAEKLYCDESTVRRNRSRLIRIIAVRLYGVEAI